MKYINKNSLIQYTVLIMILVITQWEQADQTYILQLEKEMNFRNEKVAQAIKDLSDIKKSNVSNKYYTQTKKIPKGSMDSRFAHAKYVNSEVKARTEEYKALVNLGRNSDELTKIIGKFIRELESSSKENKGFNIAIMDSKAIVRSINTVRGIQRTLRILRDDPGVNASVSQNDLTVVTMINKNIKNMVKNHSKSKNSIESNIRVMEELYETMKMQRPLIKSYLWRLDNEIQSLRVMSLQETGYGAANNVRNMVLKIHKMFNDKEYLERQKRHNEMAKLMQPEEYNLDIELKEDDDEEFYIKMMEIANSKK